MKALWLELGDSAITAIPIHFMAWSDKSATARWIKPKRESRLIRRHVIRFLDRDAVLEAHGGLKLGAFVEDFAKHQSWAHSILSAS
jgi:hypothetical protein